VEVPGACSVAGTLRGVRDGSKSIADRLPRQVRKVVIASRYSPCPLARHLLVPASCAAISRGFDGARSLARRIAFLVHKAAHRASKLIMAFSQHNSRPKHHLVIGTANRLYRIGFAVICSHALNSLC
jgi:hypothetical protein